MMAKKFFYACAGLALLALSSGLLKSPASAQTIGAIWMGDVRDHTAAVAVGRTINYLDTEGVIGGSLPPVPGASAIVAFDLVAPNAAGTPPAIAVLEDGSVYEIPGGGSSWVLVPATLTTGSAPTVRTTWGGLKTTYR